MRWIVMAQAAVGSVLVIAGLAKVVGQTSVGDLLDALGWPAALGRLTARALPVVELLCGALLVLGWGGILAPLAAAALTTGFAVTLTVAYRAGVASGCRCFGALDTATLTPVAVVRAVLLAAASLGVLAYHEPGWSGASVGLGGLTAVVYVTVFALFDRVYEFERGRAAALARIRAARTTTRAEVGR